MFLITAGILFLYTLYHIVFGVPVILHRGRLHNERIIPTSIIVCQYNEQENIPSFMKCIYDQDQINLELIVIDDQSTDQSFDLINTYKSNENHAIKVFENTAKKGKKHAQKIGFEKVNVNNVLLTDMDCLPYSSKWASKMTNALVGNDLVLGHAPFNKENTWLNKLQRYDNTWITFQYMGYALQSIPYMGVGRNMAVSSSSYQNVKHTIKGGHLKSGDDDLLVQALQYNSVVTELDPDTFMYSDAEPNYHAWLRQKKRQVSTSSLYTWKHKILLSLSAFLSIFTPLVLVLNLLLFQNLYSILLYFIYLIVLYVIKGRVLSRLKEKDLVGLLPILEVMYSIHLLILSIFVFYKKSNIWK